MDMPLNFYWHKKYKIARSYKGSNFIQYSINESGIPIKSVIDKESESFLFPWLGESLEKEEPHFFQSRAFLPIKFLYRFK